MFPTDEPGGFPNLLFQIAPYFIGIVFVIVLGTIIFRSVRGIKQWSSNNKQPVLTVQAKIITKRSEVSRRSHHHDDHHHHSTTTYYFVTFEVESGDRMEFQIHGNDYGLLAEGDQGKLTFQGTRFKGFERVA